MIGEAAGAFVVLLTQEIAYVFGEIPGRRVTLRGPLRQGLQADALQRPGDPVVHLAGRLGFDGDDLLQQFRHRLGAEGPPAAQHFVEDDAEAEDVGAAVHPVALAAGLLRTHVRRRAGEADAFAEILFLQRQPEIGEVRLAGGVDQDVGGLDVPVDQPARVGVVQGLGDRRRQFRRLGGAVGGPR